uniref:CPSF_A domain-containing protein n=1 Tax=Macrostomum lignano TaxID=282301 RepID=A0A1I8ID73_9PLAT
DLLTTESAGATAAGAAASRRSGTAGSAARTSWAAGAARGSRATATAKPWRRSAISTGLVRSVAHHLGVDSAADAILQLGVQLRQGVGVGLVHGVLVDVPDSGGFNNVADDEFLNRFIFRRAPAAVGAANTAHVAAALLATSEKEGLFCLNKDEIATLTLPTGKTKKKKKNFAAFYKSENLALSTFAQGEYLASFCSNGQIVIYRRDSNAVHVVPGPLDSSHYNSLENLSKRNPPVLFVAKDISVIVLILEVTDIYLWERSCNDASSQPSGRWFKLRWDYDTPVPDPDENCEVCVDVGYFVDKYLGPCVLVSYCFYHEGRLLVATNLSRWIVGRSGGGSTPGELISSWISTGYPADLFGSKAAVEHVRGSLLVRFCPNQPLLAVCVNQRSAEAACLVYVDVLLGCATHSSLMGLGVVDYGGRNRAGGNGTGGPGGGAGSGSAASGTGSSRYVQLLRDIGLSDQDVLGGGGGGQAGSRGAPATWVRDLAWDCRGLFLVGCTGLGFAFACARMGSPLTLTCKGCLELGPAMFLPVHPVNTLRSPGRHGVQRYSVSAHPRHPLFAMTDGYSVSLLRFPSSGAGLSGVVRQQVAHAQQVLSQLQLDPAGVLTPRLHACQRFSRDQMSRVREWHRESFGSGFDAELRVDDRDDEEREFNNRGVADEESGDTPRNRMGASEMYRISFGSIGGGGGSLYNSRAAASSVPKQQSKQTQLQTPLPPPLPPTAVQQHSDSGLHSLFGDETDPGTYFREALFYLTSAWGLLVTERGKPVRHKQRLAELVLEGFFHMASNLVLTLEEADELSQEDFLAFVLEQLHSLTGTVLEIAQFDSSTFSLCQPLTKFYAEFTSYLVASQHLRDYIPVLHGGAVAFSFVQRAAQSLAETYAWSKPPVRSFHDLPAANTWLPARLCRQLGGGPSAASNAIGSADEMLLASRLTLHEFFSKIYQSTGLIDEDVESSLCSIQAAIQASCSYLPEHEGQIIGRGERHLLEGRDEEAMVEWRRQLTELATR